MIYDTSLPLLTEERLRTLISNAVIEGRQLDYKQDAPLKRVDKVEGKDKDPRVDFVEDVIAFANTVGGDILLGMRSVNNVPVELCGIMETNLDEVKLRLESLIRDKIQPRLFGVQIHPVPITRDDGTSGHALVVRVPASLSQPHAIFDGKRFTFYTRNSAGNSPMDISALRSAFALSVTRGERIQAFRMNRIGRLEGGGHFPIHTGNGFKRLIQVVPLTAFDESIGHDVERVKEPFRKPLLTAKYASHFSYNLDGLLGFHNEGKRADPNAHNYIQVYRSGAIEGVEAERFLPNTNKALNAEAHSYQMIDNVRLLLDIQKAMEVSPPIYLMVSLVNAATWSLQIPNVHGFMDTDHTFDRRHIELPPLIIDSYAVDVAEVLKASLDILWNAANWERCLIYDEEGELKPKPAEYFFG